MHMKMQMSRRCNFTWFIENTQCLPVAQALGKAGWSAASLFAGSSLMRIEQRGTKTKGVAKRSHKPHFYSAKAGLLSLPPAISSPMAPSAALGTTFVLHHNEADNLNTRVLCGSGGGNRAAPNNELRFLLRQGCTVFYPPPCGLSYFYASMENAAMAAKRSWAGVWVVLAILIFAGIVGLGRAILLRPVDPTSQKVP